ncbi:MAG: mechanosensitive ion channel family protein [Patescibacteria group bacterium]|nr:mechanosensitive ion channel family protein [Patescibacteria group bacterium]
MNWQETVNFDLWGNSSSQYAWVLVIFIGLMILFKVFSSVVLSKLRKASEQTETDIDDFLITLVKHIKPPFYFVVSFLISVQFLSLSEIIEAIIFGSFVIIVVIQIVLTLQKVIDYIIKKRLLKPGEDFDPDEEAIIRLAGNVSKAAVWIFGGLMVLSNIGVDVTSLIAGLGIGGVALAFAFKSVLEDVFASFSIFVDKPFRIGDFIGVSDKEQGIVEKIGIKSTRLRTIEGHELVMANKALTDSALMNYRSKGERKVSFMLGVTYETSLEKLKKIPGLISDIVEKNPNTKPVRVVFKQYADSSLNFEVVFAIDLKGGVNRFYVQNDVNYEIFEVFQRENIDFAYPTQTLFVQKNQTN